MSKEKLSPSEALYGFAAWLTCRKDPVTFSSAHNAAPAAELVDAFCKANNLNDPSDEFNLKIVHPG